MNRLSNIAKLLGIRKSFADEEPNAEFDSEKLRAEAVDKDLGLSPGGTVKRAKEIMDDISKLTAEVNIADKNLADATAKMALYHSTKKAREAAIKVLQEDFEKYKNLTPTALVALAAVYGTSDARNQVKTTKGMIQVQKDIAYVIGAKKKELEDAQKEQARLDEDKEDKKPKGGLQQIEANLSYAKSQSDRANQQLKAKQAAHDSLLSKMDARDRAEQVKQVELNATAAANAESIRSYAETLKLHGASDDEDIKSAQAMAAGVAKNYADAVANKAQFPKDAYKTTLDLLSDMVKRTIAARDKAAQSEGKTTSEKLLGKLERIKDPAERIQFLNGLAPAARADIGMHVVKDANTGKESIVPMSTADRASVYSTAYRIPAKSISNIMSQVDMSKSGANEELAAKMAAYGKRVEDIEETLKDAKGVLGEKDYNKLRDDTINRVTVYDDRDKTQLKRIEREIGASLKAKADAMVKKNEEVEKLREQANKKLEQGWNTLKGQGKVKDGFDKGSPPLEFRGTLEEQEKAINEFLKDPKKQRDEIRKIGVEGSLVQTADFSQSQSEYAQSQRAKQFKNGVAKYGFDLTDEEAEDMRDIYRNPNDFLKNGIPTLVSNRMKPITKDIREKQRKMIPLDAADVALLEKVENFKNTVRTAVSAKDGKTAKLASAINSATASFRDATKKDIASLNIDGITQMVITESPETMFKEEKQQIATRNEEEKRRNMGQDIRDEDQPARFAESEEPLKKKKEQPKTVATAKDEGWKGWKTESIEDRFARKNKVNSEYQQARADAKELLESDVEEKGREALAKATPPRSLKSDPRGYGEAEAKNLAEGKKLLEQEERKNSDRKRELAAAQAAKLREQAKNRTNLDQPVTQDDKRVLAQEREQKKALAQNNINEQAKQIVSSMRLPQDVYGQALSWAIRSLSEGKDVETVRSLIDNWYAKQSKPQQSEQNSGSGTAVQQ